MKPWYIDYIDETLMGYFVSTTEADLLKDDAMQAENYYLEPTTERGLQDLNQYHVDDFKTGVLANNDSGVITISHRILVLCSITLSCIVYPTTSVCDLDSS